MNSLVNLGILLLAITSVSLAQKSFCAVTYVYGICRLQRDPNAAPNVTGTIDIRQAMDCRYRARPTEYKLDIAGLPTGDNITEHGFHVHQYADLSTGCTGAGGHYNPLGVDHGAPDAPIRHVGDLGNIIEKSDGTIKTTLTDNQANLLGQYSIYGHALVVHEKRDDLGLGGDATSKTTGNAGGRLACCIIGHADGTRWS